MATEVTTAEAAKMLGVTPRHVRWYYYQGLLAGRVVDDKFTRGPLLVFRRADVEQFVKPKKSGRPKATQTAPKVRTAPKKGRKGTG